MTKKIYLSFVLLLASGALFAQTRQVQLFPNGEEGVPVQAGDVFTIRANGLTVPKHPVLGTALKAAGAALAAYNADRLVHAGTGTTKTLESSNSRNAVLSVVGAGVVLSAGKIASIGSRPGSWLSYEIYDNQAHVAGTGFVHLKKQNGQLTLTGKSPVAGLLKISRTDGKGNPLTDAAVTVNIEAGPQVSVEGSFPTLAAAPFTIKVVRMPSRAPLIAAPAIMNGVAPGLAVIPSFVSHGVSLPATKAIGLRAATIKSKLAAIPLARNSLEASSFGLKATNVKTSLPTKNPADGSAPAEKAPFEMIDDSATPLAIGLQSDLASDDENDAEDAGDDEGDDLSDPIESFDGDDDGGGDGGDAGDGSDGSDGSDADGSDSEDDGENDDDGVEETQEIIDDQDELESYSGSDYELDFRAWYTEKYGLITSVYGGSVQALPPIFRKNLPNGNYQIVTVRAKLIDFEVVTFLPAACVTIEWTADEVVTITTFNSNGTKIGYYSYEDVHPDVKELCA